MDEEWDSYAQQGIKSPPPVNCPRTGLAYKDDPAVVAFELINEPHYPEGTTDAQVTAHIDALAGAVRATGCRKPVFYNGWGGRLAAVAASRADGSSFGWYPTGLVVDGAAPIAIFDAARDAVRVHGQTPNRVRTVSGLGPGAKALRIEVDRFGPPPSCISFRCEAADVLDPRRGDLAGRTSVVVRARSAAPATTRIEVGLIESDGTADESRAFGSRGSGVTPSRTTPRLPLRDPMQTFLVASSLIRSRDSRGGRRSPMRIFLAVVCWAVSAYMFTVAGCVFRVWSNWGRIMYSPTHEYPRFSLSSFVVIPLGGTTELSAREVDLVIAGVAAGMAMLLLGWLLFLKRRPPSLQSFG